MRFILFGYIWYCLVALQNSVQNGPKWCKSSCHEVVLEFFATNAPDPPYWTLTSCFVAFRTICLHLGQFVALQHSVQNGLNWWQNSCHEVASEFFVANAPNLAHCTLNSCFGVFCTIWTVWLPYKTQCKTGRTGAKVRATESRLKFSHQTHPILPIGS